MRRKQRATDVDIAWDLLRERRVVHLATVTPEGQPVLRVLNAVVDDGWVMFHGALAGEKSSCIGQPAVVSVHEEVALIPSYFVDPEMACPATSYYRAAQAHGVLKNVDDPAQKAAALQRFMEFQQPEGGHRPIVDADPEYRKEVRAVRVFGVEVTQVTGKENLGQDRPPERTCKVVEGLWRRGAPGDVQAIRTILGRSPAATPSWLLAPPPLAEEGVQLVVHPTPSELKQAASLLQGRYWKLGASEAEIVTSHQRSSAWVGALDAQGRLLGTARALADASARGFVYDVVVAEAYQRRGIGTALLRLLLQHPAVRGCEKVLLATLDRASFYGHFGFAPLSAETLMVRTRPAAAQ